MAMSEDEKRLKQKERDEARQERRDEWIPFIAYEEILDDQFFSKLSGMGYEVIVGCVHDSDINDNGEHKKKHRHCLAKFRGYKYIETYYEELKAVFGVSEFGTCIGIPYPEKLKKTPSGCVRYMMHLDNPEKYQYTELPIGLCGINPLNLLYNDGDTIQMLDEISRLILEKGFEYPHELIAYLQQEKKRGLLVLYYNKKTYLINSMLAGQHKRNMEKRRRDERRGM